MIAEHGNLGVVLDRMRSLADRLGMVGDGSQMRSELVSLDFDLQRILAHERADETELHPEIAGLVGGQDPLSAISRTHREVAHLGRRFSRHLADVPKSGPDVAEQLELRRILYALEAILRLHFAQEDEIYESVSSQTNRGAAAN